MRRRPVLLGRVVWSCPGVVMAVLRCPVCSELLSEESRFCSACGAALTAAEPLPTAPYQGAALPGPTAPPFPQAARFTPGQILAGRYRIVSRLGKGGMGEVYRAEDLRLGQTVALKFLPAALGQDPDRLRRLHNEVRVARQVSHPNVCRVYDIAEADGETLLTMEFIDGQTLAALLRQVGRLPHERGVEIARQLCLGLAAVHEHGIIHRDLKPHNVMLDQKGRVRITDFGLAAEADDIHGSEVARGTPAYMAPEQLAGQAVSVQSDIYALGLILHETFTGRHAFVAKTPEGLQRADNTPRPSSHLTGVDPGLERLILRCLERDPRDRPASALAVLAALPGGDPLTAALAAGETPSPEMVANAEVDGSVPPRMALGLLVATLVIVVALAVLADRVKFFRRVPFESSPEQLTFSARQMLRKLGYVEPPGDTAWGYEHDVAYQLYLNRQSVSAERWQGLATGRPPIHYFWYRQSPSFLEAGSRENPYGAVTPSHPPLSQGGMVTLYLDPQGRLVEFHAVPDGRSTTEVDWAPLWEWAGLDASRFQPVAPQQDAPLGADGQLAWAGTFPERPDVPLTVEAASARGRPVFFLVSTPGRDAARLLAAGEQPNQRFRAAFEIAFPLLVVTGCGVLAWRNFRRNRLDRRGAQRLGLFAFGLMFASWVLRAHQASLLEMDYSIFLKALGHSLASAGLLWVAYMAVEPYLRRRWPWRIVSWNRLLAGRFRDPLVGRDILLGALLGSAETLLNALEAIVCEALSLPSDIYFARINLETMSLARLPHFLLLMQADNGLWGCLTVYAMFFLLYLLCRREWLAGLGVTAVWTIVFLSGPDYLHLVNATFVVVRCLLVVYFGLRFGLLTILVFGFYWSVLAFGPITYDLGTWYAASTVVSFVCLVAVALYGFVVAKAGRAVLSADWIERV